MFLGNLHKYGRDGSQTTKIGRSISRINRAQPPWKIILELKSKIGAKEDEFNSDGYRKSNFISPNNN